MDGLNTAETKVSMAEIFIHLLSFVLLGTIANATGFLYFQIINKYFPDVLSAFYQNYQISSINTLIIRYSTASLIVVFPIYVWAMWFWFKSFNLPAGGPQKVESKLPKWLTYIVLFIAGGTIIGDLITIIYNFLQGEYGARFLLKALVVFVIAILVFSFYFLERKKIQYKKEIRGVYFLSLAIFAAAIISLAIVLGFIVGGTPGQARLRNFDSQRASDLTQISSCVSNFSYDNNKLPSNLNELKNNSRYYYCSKTSDPETGKNYEYRIISENEYELCAEFSLSTMDESQNDIYYTVGSPWAKHDKGRVCLDQTVTFRERINNLPVPRAK